LPDKAYSVIFEFGIRAQIDQFFGRLMEMGFEDIIGTAYQRKRESERLLGLSGTM
jgi:hypothetical protein